MRYQLGQQVWHARWDAVATTMECPDCAGTAISRVMLPDDTIVSIECEGCRHGYNGSSGRVQVYNRTPRVELVTITGVEIDRDGITAKYSGDGVYQATEADVFDNSSAAMVRALDVAEAADREERERFTRKEKPLKSWAWHANYHRRLIKENTRQIEYHTRALAHASLKAKEPKSEEPTAEACAFNRAADVIG